MVLRILLCVLLVVFSSEGLAKKRAKDVKKSVIKEKVLTEAEAYEKAVKLSSQNPEQALQVLEKHFNLSHKALPLKVATLATNLAKKLENWRKVERVADSTLSNNWPGWPSLKTKSSQLLPLLKISTEAKTKIFEDDSDLSVDQKKKLKSEIQAYTEAMIQHGYEKPAAEAVLAEVKEQPVVAPGDNKMSVALAASYWTWEDRPSFEYALKAKAVLYTPCAGAALNYVTGKYTWSGALCGGVGHATLQFTDGTFDNDGSVTLITGQGSMLYRISDDGAAYGLEGDFLSVEMKGKAAGAREVSATNQDFAAMIVGRFSFGKMDLKFKGGMVVAKPSAIWAVDLSYPIF